ncbi:MAG TPA: glycoside hydrolase family 2 TIM barrel-domain containing protein [Lachnospiraceae bacterium]|nr:glycoside hydrolase family 2 TIM barrel-domain containing protein [Lachnospiraceae bacterium]
MNADIKWLDNPEVFRVNQLPAHSDHTFFESKDAYEQGESKLKQSLNGNWKFCYSVNAAKRPVNFYEEGYDCSDFDELAVPRHIEMAGYDKIHYINVNYPWEGHIYRRPPFSLDGKVPVSDSFSGADYNPVGSYLKRFDLSKEMIGKRVTILFEGVEQAMYLWINGHFVGYAEDSFTPSEFDLTPYVREKGNVLAVEVHKRSTAAFLEDQDFFRFFGIFRNVTLYAKPALHVEDMWAKPGLLDDYTTGTFSLNLKLSSQTETMPKEGKVLVALCDQNGKTLFEKQVSLAEEVNIDAENVGTVIPWCNHNPYLYNLGISLFDQEGKLVEYVPYRVGFRRLEIRNKVILLNGERLILNGVNRHEWNAEEGRCLQMKDMETDMKVFLENNINAVRTCHYPDQIPWYYLCDENGIYMIAETNMETHGSWQKIGGFDTSWTLPGSIPEWKAAVLDRAQNNFETFKNHTAVLFWSLGNESFAGDNIAYMNQYFKEKDNTRLVHYEGVVHNPSYKDRISDVETQMYTQPVYIEEYLKNDPQKPFILCEYMHDMGNSMGGLKSYIELIDKYEMYQGGFIWDFIDQAILVTDAVTGEKVLRYGGDFDDRPADYEFSGDGIMFADRTAKPALQEVRYLYGLH